MHNQYVHNCRNIPFGVCQVVVAPGLHGQGIPSSSTVLIKPRLHYNHIADLKEQNMSTWRVTWQEHTL